MAHDSLPPPQPRRPGPFTHPRISGGDGSTLEQAVHIRATGLDMALMLMQLYLEQTHGVKGRDWLPVTEQWVDSANHPPRTLRLIELELADSTPHRCYFNLAPTTATPPPPPPAPAASAITPATAPPLPQPAPPPSAESPPPPAPLSHIAADDTPPPPEHPASAPSPDSPSTAPAEAAAAPPPHTAPPGQDPGSGPALDLTWFEQISTSPAPPPPEPPASRLAWRLILATCALFGALAMHLWLTSPQGREMLRQKATPAPVEDAGANEPEDPRPDALRKEFVGYANLPRDETIQASFLKAANAWGDALVREDYVTLKKLAPPQVQEGADRPWESFLMTVKASSPKSFRLGSMSPLALTRDKVLALIPTETTYLHAGREDLVTTPGHLVGISHDGWSWMLASDSMLSPSSVREALPELALLFMKPTHGDPRHFRPTPALGGSSPPAPLYTPQEQAEVNNMDVISKGLLQQAQAGHVAAMTKLAARLHAQDPRSHLARQWLHRAADMDFAPALIMRAGLLQDGLSAGSAVPAEWFKWMERAARQGDAQAQLALGDMYSDSLHSNLVNTEKGLEWIEMAATQNLPEAQVRLASTHANGTHPTADRDEARRLLEAAANQGHPTARATLGMILLQDGSYDQAFETLILGAWDDDAHCQAFMGLIYKDGLGREKDLLKACMWSILAARSKTAPSLTQLRKVKESMSRGQIENAERLAAAFQPRLLPKAAHSPGELLGVLSTRPPASASPAFCIREDGYFLTTFSISTAGRSTFVVVDSTAHPAWVVAANASAGYTLLKVSGSFFALEPSDFNAPQKPTHIWTGRHQANGFSSPATLAVERQFGQMYRGNLRLDYEEGMAGAPAYTMDGLVLGMVLPTATPASGKQKPNCQVLPAKSFPTLPPANGKWIHDRTWRRRLTVEAFDNLTLKASALAVVYE